MTPKYYATSIAFLLVYLLSISLVSLTPARHVQADTHVPQQNVIPQQPMSPSTAEGPCANFADVSTHYYGCFDLTWMVNRGYVGGYDDPAFCSQFGNGAAAPCFLPHRGVTRGQFSKILGSTFGRSYSGSDQFFTDVPYGSAFYTWVMALYREGVISGYSDEAFCWSYGTHAPCFLPGNPVTRGQMAKMVSNIADFRETPQPGRQTFADVAPDHTFYLFIERLVMHNVNTPYPPDMPQPDCGSSTKPCYAPMTHAARIDAVVMVYLGKNLSPYPLFAQVFPHRKGEYDGISSWVVTPNRFPVAGSQFFAPVGLSDYYNYHFVESGFEGRCDSQNNCARHPYGSWRAGQQAGNAIGGWNTSINITAGQGYTYKSIRTGTNSWTAYWCDATRCEAMITTGDLGRSSFPYVIAGGESVYPHSWGTLYLYDNYARHPNGSWSAWCYDPTLAPIVTIEPVSTAIGPCSYSNWTVRY